MSDNSGKPNDSHLTPKMYEDLLTFTHTFEFSKLPENHPFHGNPDKVSEEQIHAVVVNGCLCGQVIFRLFGGELLITVHMGYGHGLSWRIIEQQADGRSKCVGDGSVFAGKSNDEFINALTAAFPDGVGRTNTLAMMNKLCMI